MSDDTKPYGMRPEVEAAWNFPLFEAMMGRRSRRFGFGMELEYGPFTYKGRILEPVDGWTTHHSIVEWNGRWWLFYADTQLSGQTRLRNVKVTELFYNPDGTIRTIDPMLK